MHKLMRNGFCRDAALVLFLVFASSIVLSSAGFASPGPEQPSASAGPRAQYSLAILPLEATGRISAEEAATLTDRLRSELETTGIFTVTEQSVVESALHSAGLLEAGCSTVECGAEAGKLLSTQLVVNGSIRKVGQMFFVEVQMIHVNSGRVVQKANEDFDGDLDRLHDFMRTVARKLVGRAPQSSGSLRTVSATQSQELTSTEHSGATQEFGEGETGAEEPIKTTEIKRGGNKFLVFGLVAAGAVGAGVLISQATSKDSNGKKDDHSNNTLTDLPDPPRFP